MAWNCIWDLIERPPAATNGFSCMTRSRGAPIQSRDGTRIAARVTASVACSVETRPTKKRTRLGENSAAGSKSLIPGGLSKPAGKLKPSVPGLRRPYS